MRTKIEFGKKYLIEYDHNYFIGKLIGNDETNLIVQIETNVSENFNWRWGYKNLEKCNVVTKVDKHKSFLFILDDDIIKQLVNYYPNTKLYRKLYPNGIVKNNLLEVEL
jgi:hypothetical protein